MIRRQVIDAIGYMDEASFPAGYGEENDYCIRASEAGYYMAIADDVYVFHAKSKSFGHKNRKKLSAEGSQQLKRKHTRGKVEKLIKSVKEIAALDEIRSAVKEQIEEAQRGCSIIPDLKCMRILFLLPVRGGGGGAISVVQEASEMRRLGIEAHVAVRNVHLQEYLNLFDDIERCQELFIGLDDLPFEHTSCVYDVVIATIFSSVSRLKQVVNENPHVLPAYYVQDYEPFFFPPGSSNRALARESYNLVPEMILFAKTQWIAERIKTEHGLNVYKVEPSIDHRVYKPARKPKGRRLHIAAMIRPSTPRRGAERTMRLLSRLTAAHGNRIVVNLFGCDEDDPQFQALQRDFSYRNHGRLKRSDVAAVLGESDVFLDLSDYQAFGRTALEAMACGCMAVVPVHGGTDEYAIDGVNALVVDPLDERECFKRCELVECPDRLREMQLAGLETASRYSVHRAAISELALFSKALAEHRRCSPRNTRDDRPRVFMVPSCTRVIKGARNPAGSGYVRVVYPYRSLTLRKQVRLSNWLADGLPDPGSARAIVLQRHVPDATIDSLDAWMQAWRRAGGRVGYELDDDLFDEEILRSQGLASSGPIAAQAQWLARNADVVSVTTNVLAQRASVFNPNVIVIPNSLDEELWGLAKGRLPPEPQFARVPGQVKIGYVGTPTHRDDLEMISGAMSRIAGDFGEHVAVEVIGGVEGKSAPFGSRVPLPRKHDYPSFVDWLQRRVHWDIGLVPLVDNAINKSKSHLKFLECAALGMAMACSDVEALHPVARHGENCLVVPPDEDAWYRAVAELIESPSLRLRLEQNALDLVTREHTLRSTDPLRAKFLALLVGA